MSKKSRFAFIASFILLIAIVVLNRLTFNEMKDYASKVDHTRDVITTFESISDDFKSAQIYTPNYTEDSLKNFYTLFKNDADSIEGELHDLAGLIADNPVQVKLVNELSAMIHAQMPVLMQKNIAEMIKVGEAWRINDLFLIHRMIIQGIINEKKLLAERKSALEEFTHFNNILTTAFGVIAVAVILFTFLSNFFISKQTKWLEGFLESILDTSQNGIVHYKAIRERGKIVDFRLGFVNKPIDALMQIKSAELVGKKLSEFPSYVIESDLFSKYVQVVESGESLQFETLYKRPGIERWFLLSLSKLKDGLIASFNDITQLKKYETELKQNIKDLERSNIELEQYAYVASHDLQEPLRKIRSFGSFLQDTQGDRLDDRGRLQLDKMMGAAERMSSLIKDILSYSSLNKQAAFVSTNLNEVVQTVLQDLDLVVTQKNAVINCDDLPVIEAIPLQMRQLFYNLLNNSLKFSKENMQAVVNIHCRKLREGEKIETLASSIPYYEIIVSDNGIGFGQDYAPQIFGLFKRLNDKQFYPGSGIGLSLCKKVVENHNGLILARGKENEGASFYIYLPEKQNGNIEQGTRNDEI